MPTDETTPDVSNLVRRITLDEFLGWWDRRIERHPERAGDYAADKIHWRSQVEPELVKGGELWTWRRPLGDVGSGALGVAVVRNGRVVTWWLRGVYG